MRDVLVLVACSAGMFHHSRLSKANALFAYLLHMNVTWSLNFVGLYFRVFMNVCSYADMALQEYLQKKVQLKVWKDKRLCLP